MIITFSVSSPNREPSPKIIFAVHWYEFRLIKATYRIQRSYTIHVASRLRTREVTSKHTRATAKNMVAIRILDCIESPTKILKDMGTVMAATQLILSKLLTMFIAYYLPARVWKTRFNPIWNKRKKPLLLIPVNITTAKAENGVSTIPISIGNSGLIWHRYFLW